MRVAIAICTYNRSAELRSLLRRVATLASVDLGGAERFRIVVVDDSRDSNAAPIIDEFRAEVGTIVELIKTASGDVSKARNAAITAASADTDFVVCIDDDCLPHPGWLAALLVVAEATSADVIVGHRQFVAPDDAPRWLREEPFAVENALYPDRSDPTFGNTANVMIRSAWLRSSNVAFRKELGRSGGEDMVFVDDARKKGAIVRFAAGSVVDEPYDRGRTTLGYHLWRQMWLGNNEAAINGHTHELSRARLVLRGARRCLSGLARPVRRVATGESAQLRWALARILSGIGLIAGAAGLRVSHHR
jgi:succinoglycan biosynthesis protein ExoM